MRFSEKLSNFFASSFTNNSKFNSSFLVYLRLLFERNNKYKSTFDKLGNVFRNSKWNNLKVQNIKTTLINSWFSYLAALSILLLLGFSFFGYSSNFNTFLLPAFFSEIWGTFFFIFAQVSNTVTLGILKLSFLVLALKVYLSQLLSFNSTFIFETFTRSSNTHKSTKGTKSDVFELSHHSYFSPETLLLTHNLSKVNYTLNKLYDSKRVENFIRSIKFQTETPIEFLLYESTDITFSEDCTWKPSQLYQSIISYRPNFTFSTKSLKLDLGSLNKLQNLPITSSLSNFNIYKNLNQSKQNRWLLKNSILSNNTATGLSNFTQVKNLIGNTMYDSLNTSHNIWNSSKLTQLSKAAELTTLSFFQANKLGNPFLNTNQTLNLMPSTPSNLQNFNFFETSQLWSTKKFFFTNQLKTNTLQLVDSSKTYSNRTDTHNHSANSKLTTLLNLLNYSFSIQVQNLFVSSSVKNPESYTSQDLTPSSFQASMLNTGDLDHLKTFNTGFLLDLTTVNSISYLPIYTFTNSTDLGLKHSKKLQFNTGK